MTKLYNINIDELLVENYYEEAKALRLSISNLKEERKNIHLSLTINKLDIKHNSLLYKQYNNEFQKRFVHKFIDKRKGTLVQHKNMLLTELDSIQYNLHRTLAAYKNKNSILIAIINQLKHKNVLPYYIRREFKLSKTL